MKEIDINEYGIYRMGLTTKEIKEYLKMRAGTTKLGNLYQRFCNEAGINTMAMVADEQGNKITLMYRWDVERFVKKLLDGTPTYWD